MNAACYARRNLLCDEFITTRRSTRVCVPCLQAEVMLAGCDETAYLRQQMRGRRCTIAEGRGVEIIFLARPAQNDWSASGRVTGHWRVECEDLKSVARYVSSECMVNQNIPAVEICLPRINCAHIVETKRL
jgi:hypothetical protein